MQSRIYKLQAIMMILKILAQLLFISQVVEGTNPCRSQHDVSVDYSRLSDVNRTGSFLWPVASALYSQCVFGNTRWLPSKQTCFAHCSIRDNCIATATSESGDSCRLCMKLGAVQNDLNSTMANNVYLRLDHLIPQDCRAIYDYGLRNDGIYTINPGNEEIVDAYCELSDTSNGGGGWTVFHRRVDGLIDFNRNREAYESGFGDLAASFWLGLTYLSRLTETADVELIIDLEDVNTERRYARYSTFHVGDVTDGYRLSVDGHSGTASNRFMTAWTQRAIINNMRFSTHDWDNDNKDGSCAQQFSSGWWFNLCFEVNLNLPYGHNLYKWPHYGNYQIKTSVMKLRRRN